MEEKEKITVYINYIPDGRVAVTNGRLCLYYRDTHYLPIINNLKTILKRQEIEKVVCSVPKLRLRLMTEGFIVEK